MADEERQTLLNNNKNIYDLEKLLSDLLFNNKFNHENEIKKLEKILSKHDYIFTYFVSNDSNNYFCVYEKNVEFKRTLELYRFNGFSRDLNLNKKKYYFPNIYGQSEFFIANSNLVNIWRIKNLHICHPSILDNISLKLNF